MMNLNDLLNLKKETDLSPKEFENRAYWFRHVYQLKRLNLPINNSYGKSTFAYACIERAIDLVEELDKEYDKIPAETFANALGRAVPEVNWPNSSRRSAQNL